jgi:branched-chain amino acid aminotransferase
MHRFALHNETICQASEAVLMPGQVGLLSGWGVFSTICVKEGVLFAWERHWARMQRDATLMHVPFPTDPEFVHSLLLRLVDANAAWTSTLRVAIVRNLGGMWQGHGITRNYDLIAFTADNKEWGSNVRLGVVPQARHSACVFAGTKILAWATNLVWVEEAHNKGYDEVVLLNERDEVSECTSANIFIAEGNKAWTPPLHSGCLPGVTRDVLLSEVHVSGIEIGERDLRLEDLARADEVFITSTTRGLLPVKEIEGIQVHQKGEVRKALAQAFTSYVSAYVSGKKRPAPVTTP